MARWAAAPALVLAATALLGPVLLADAATPVDAPGAQAIGTCHAVAVVEERTMVSDARPAVPCDGRHRAETIARGALPAGLASQRSRPDADALRAVVADLACGYDQVAAYLGTDELDPHWFVLTEVRFPTPEAWAAGERRYRCDAVAAGPDAEGGVPWRGTLHDIMGRADSAEVRPCLDGADLVPCTRSHDAEVLGSDGPDPEQDPDGWAAYDDLVCPMLATGFLGIEPSGLGLVAEASRRLPGRSVCTVRAADRRDLPRGTLAAQAEPGPS